jgi:hypothetical protein
MNRAAAKAARRYVAAAIATQADSPLPGPADAGAAVFAIGTTVALLVDVGIALFSDDDTPVKADSDKERVEATDKAEGIDRTSTIGLGSFAARAIKAHRGRPTSTEQEQINELGDEYGCHTCGATEPGTKYGDWVGDHQPPQALDEPKVFVPQCLECARRQGGQVLQEKRRREREGS